jgi:uncharacterized protein (TIGR02246 family)
MHEVNELVSDDGNLSGPLFAVLRGPCRRRTFAPLSNSGEFLPEILMMNKRSLIWGSLALVMLVTSAVAQAAAAEQAVTAAEHQWLKSQQTNNVELLAPLLAEKVVETTAEGKVIAGKDAVLADAKSDTWSSAEYTDLKVTVFGNTAIATGTFIGKGKSAAGKPLDERVRFTDTWVKMPDGKWLCVASHDSLLKT